jgi:hypothetical protein
LPLYVSPSANLKVSVQSKTPVFSQKTGEKIATTRQIRAQFAPGGALPVWAKEQALARLSWRGLPPEIQPGEQIAWFDSDQYAYENDLSAEEKQLLEDVLERQQGEDFVRVEQPKIEAPWKSYAELTVHGRRTAAIVAEKIVELVQATGTDPEHVIRYERENRRPGSDEIVAAMEALKAQPQEEDAGPPLVAA